MVRGGLIEGSPCKPELARASFDPRGIDSPRLTSLNGIETTNLKSDKKSSKQSLASSSGRFEDLLPSLGFAQPCVSTAGV